MWYYVLMNVKESVSFGYCYKFYLEVGKVWEYIEVGNC